MPFYGSLVVIKRSGGDGSIFPLTCKEVILGRDVSSDIRIQLPSVSAKHAKIIVNENNQVNKDLHLF